MKRKVFILKITILFLSTMISITACNKEGLKGVKGPTGTAGAAGAIGPAGKNGSTFLKGKGTPDSETGKTGDYYLDENNSSLYGPKTNEGWGNPFIFSGHEGGKMYGGSGFPNAATGLKGDFYLDTAGYTLYGPKQSDQHWGPGIYLNGSGGSTGVTEYIINNPNDYFTNGMGDTRYNFYLHIPNDDNNHFNLFQHANEQHDLIKVYFKQKITIYNDSEDSTGYYYTISPATGQVNTNSYSEREIEASYITAQDGLYIYFNNTNNICECEGADLLSLIKKDLGLSEIRIYVISSSAVDSIAPPVLPVESTSFSDSADGWTISGDAKGGFVDASYSGSGGVSDGYIYAKDDVINGVWYFKAPVAYKGHHPDYYGATLSFSLFQHAATTSQFEAADIILENGSLKIVCQLPKHPDSTWTSYQIKISPEANWRNDDYNGTKASGYQIGNVLRHITGFYIRGEYDNGSNEGGMDDVQITGN